jgi:archaellum component FlaF (FlaF/FlaG flagellin family)
MLISCQKANTSFPDQGTLPKGLTGSWVEVNTSADTINFSTNNDSGYFNLSRGFAMTNGYWLPKIGSTSYSYIISGDSITVVDGLSNSMEGGTYSFRFDGPNLTINIGKFSKYIATKKSLLTFRKIK